MHPYEENRAKFKEEDLSAYNGQLVAFSTDGSRLIAGAHDFVTLDNLILAAGEDPEEVCYERIVLENNWQGAIEFA